MSLVLFLFLKKLLPIDDVIVGCRKKLQAKFHLNEATRERKELITMSGFLNGDLILEMKQKIRAFSAIILPFIT